MLLESTPYPINKSATIEVIQNRIVEHELEKARVTTVRNSAVTLDRDHLCPLFWNLHSENILYGVESFSF
jgi:hypothetical protein